ncbi:mycofactocin-coupled SDR family oxidoreductase [Pseudonocardia xishanensis]
MQDKVALITGAARGQGRSHALAFAQEGADVIAVDIAGPIRNLPYPHATAEDLASTVAQVEAFDRRIVPIEADVRNLDILRERVRAAVNELGGLDVVVANAGICIPAAWDAVTEEVFRDTLDVNTVGAWNTVMASAPHLIKRGGGSIVLVSSVAGLKVVPFMVNYTASKFAVTGMGKAFAAELGMHGIRVNTVHPGGVPTPMTAEGTTMQIIADAARLNPRIAGMMGDFLPVDGQEPEDISAAVLFLASDDSRNVTGQALAVDAGATQY